MPSVNDRNERKTTIYLKSPRCQRFTRVRARGGHSPPGQNWGILSIPVETRPRPGYFEELNATLAWL